MASSERPNRLHTSASHRVLSREGVTEIDDDEDGDPVDDRARVGFFTTT